MLTFVITNCGGVSSTPGYSDSPADGDSEMIIDSAGLGPSPSPNIGDRSISVKGPQVVFYQASVVRGSNCFSADFSLSPEIEVADAFSFPITTNGQYTVCARGRLPNGNWSPVVAAPVLEIDTVLPALSWMSPAENTEADTGLEISGACESGLDVDIAGSGSLSTFSTDCQGGFFSVFAPFTSTDGTKTISISQTDEAGNTYSTNRDFVRSGLVPFISFHSPAAGTKAVNTLQIAGSCEAGLTVALGGPGTLSPSTTSCLSGNYSVVINLTAGDGHKEVTVSQTNANGNVGSATRNFIRDTTAPVLTYLSPAASAVLAYGTTITGTCENELPVSLSGAGLSSPNSTSCVGGQFSQDIVLTAVDGVKEVRVSQVDDVGNIGSALRYFIKDTTAPVLSFVSPAANSPIGSTFAVSGTCENGMPVILSGAGLLSPGSTTCSSSTFNQVVTVDTAFSVVTVTASQTDSGGNTGQANRSFVKSP